MKLFLSLILFLFIISLTIAQENQSTSDVTENLDDFTKAKRHEVSIDVLAGLVFPALQPRYEYILSRYSGVGADVFIALNNDDIDTEELEKLSITPFYRQYFFSKEDYGAKGFYGEGFVKAYTYEDDEYDSVNNRLIRETFFETAIGISIGWKWVSNSGFMIDLGFGVGRNLGFTSESEDNRNVLIPRGGVHFGWRF